MKRKLYSLFLILTITVVMTFGSTSVSWAAGDLSSLEAAIRSGLESFTAEELTSDGDLLFFVYDLLPDDQKDSKINIYRDKFEEATTEKDGFIQFYVAIDDDLVTEEGNPFIARIPKIAKVDNTPSPQLDEDWKLASKAMNALKVSNNLTKEKLLKAAQAAVKNGSKCQWNEGFYKQDATQDKEGKIQGELILSLNGKTRVAGYNKTIPVNISGMPKKGISVTGEEWRILRNTNKERFEKGKKLLTMVPALQTACDTRGDECAKYKLQPHKRPNGSGFQTAISSAFGRSNCGENLYECTDNTITTAEQAFLGWMNSTTHRKNLLNAKWNYIGVGVNKNIAVQIFASRNTPIVKYTTSTGKKSFNSVKDMEDAYLICTDSAGRKSYLPLSTDYMKKVKGGYTLNLFSKKTIKIEVKESAYTYSDVASKDKAAVKWAVMKKLILPLSKKEFGPDIRITKGEIFYAIHRANGAPKNGLQNIRNWFVDLDRSASYYTAVFWAKKTGLIDYGQFNGESTLTRGEGLYYVWKSVGSPKVSKKTTFTDFRKDVFYANAVAWAQAKGIITDNGDHKFEGDDHICTRGEMARYLYYAYK